MSESNNEHAVVEAIAAYRCEELHRELMLWQLVLCDKWMVPVDKSDGETSVRTRAGDEERPSFVVAFSEPGALEAAREGGEIADLGDDWVFVSSDTLLGFVSADEGLLINPHTEHSLAFGPGEADEIREAGRISGIERALSMTRRPPLSEQALRSIGSYADFQLIVRNENRLDLAPDSGGRALLATFTSPEALDIYMQQTTELTKKFGVPRVLTLDGAELAVKLTQLEILGVVFNCAGPNSPLALHRNLGAQVLEAIRTTE